MSDSDGRILAGLMWTGKRFVPERPILAVALVKGTRTAEYILNGETVEVIVGPGPSSENLVVEDKRLCRFRGGSGEHWRRSKRVRISASSPRMMLQRHPQQSGAPKEECGTVVCS